MIDKIKRLNKSKRLFLKKTLSIAGCGLTLSPTLFYINKIQSATKPKLPKSIEEYTEGKVKVTDVISSKNIAYVKELVDPSTYKEVMLENREILLSPAEEFQETLFPPFFYQATRRNNNNLIFDKQSNVVNKDGSEWPGGLPFPNGKSVKEIICNLALGWNRHDQDVNAINGSLIDEAGNIEQSFEG